MVNVYPNRFMVFAQIAYSKIDNANFGAEMVQQLDDSVRRGARGLKVLKDLGLGVKDKSGNLIAVDDPRLDPVWEECGKLGIPVAMHTSDPEAFFEPADNRNERYEALMHNPTWSFYGPQFPNKETLLPERNHLFEKHPHTRPNSAASPGARESLSRSIRIAYSLEQTAIPWKRCTPTICDGWKQRMNTLITGAIQSRDAGESMV